MVEAARRMKAACTAAPGCVAHVSMCTSSGTNPARTISRLRYTATKMPFNLCCLEQTAEY